MCSFTSRTYIVSGGLSGIGLSTTLRLAAARAHIWVADISTKIPVEISSHPQSSNIHVPKRPTDIRFRDQCHNLTTEVIKQHKRLDGLVNCAGICVPEPGDDLEGLDVIFQREFDINVKGTFNLATEAFREMSGQESQGLAGRGAIVNTCSIAAQQGIAGLSIYCGSKHAVLGLTRGWSLDWAKQGIRVNAVAPGVTKTPMYDEQFKGDKSGDVAQGLIDSIPMGKLARPEDISSTILFLLSDEASHTTGEMLVVSGGA